MKSSQLKLLVTGFGAFEEFDRNPSQDIAQIANGQTHHNVQVTGLSLPVSWERAWPLLEKAVFNHRPSGLLMLGLAPGHWFRFERLAINENDPYLDNDNNRPISSIIECDGPSQIASTLPLDWLLEQTQNLPTRLSPEIRYSDNAGGYLCNHVYYHAMNSLENIVPWRGFIHVPSYPIGDPSSVTHISESEIVEIGLFLVERFAYWLSLKQAL